MSVFLIDYENVSTSGLDGLHTRTTSDQIFIFYTENADRLTFDIHQKLIACQAVIQYIKVEAGSKNALDFQLATYLGYLIAGNTSRSYYIVSKDNGFDSVQNFWKKNHVSVLRIPNLDVETSRSEHEELRTKLQEILDSKDIQVVFGMIDKYKTKQGLNNALMKQFDNKRTSEIYRVIKPYIASKKGH